MIPTPNNKFETATEESVVYRQHGNFSNSDMCESDNLTERINQEITKFKNYRWVNQNNEQASLPLQHPALAC